MLKRQLLHYIFGDALGDILQNKFIWYLLQAE